MNNIEKKALILYIIDEGCAFKFKRLKLPDLNSEGGNKYSKFKDKLIILSFSQINPNNEEVAWNF